MPKSNRIPRAATKLEVTSLLDRNDIKKGDVFTVEKHGSDWVGNIHGKVYRFFVQHLRNENYYSIKVI